MCNNYIQTINCKLNFYNYLKNLYRSCETKRKFTKYFLKMSSRYVKI